jgi:type III secretion system YscD/HrpQ family protein
MAGYLIAEEGPLAGLIVRLDQGSEWILGRDPDEAAIVLEDPMVSRKHVICHLTTEGFTLENLSSVNPATQNGKVITEEVLLKEGDILEIGSTFFRFTEQDPTPLPEESEEPPVLFEEAENLPSLDFEMPPPTRWLLKVVSGPNSGAEFSLHPSSSYLLGKDPNTCDLVFYDLSVSKEHARIQVDEQEKVFIEDLGSRNGVIVNGTPITEKQEVSSQDLIALGTTSFLILDRQQIHETIAAPPHGVFAAPSTTPSEPLLEPAVETPRKKEEHWKDLIISKKHLLFAGLFCLCLLALTTAVFSLFKSKEVEIEERHEGKKLTKALEIFPSVQFSFNEASGKLFLIGHVLTSIEKQELTYVLSTLPFIRSIEDTVIIDELVWQNMNAVLQTNPNWQAVSIHSPSPGKFVLQGYVQTPEIADALSEYMNTHFPYLDLLETNVSVANTLTVQLESLFLQKGFKSVVFNLTAGDLVLTGPIDQKRSSEFSDLVKELKKIPGIRSVKNYVVYTSMEMGSSLIDISKQYKVSGISKGDNDEQYAIINAKIFSAGEVIDGMQIKAIEPDHVLLEKDGIKFRINYNLQ